MILDILLLKKNCKNKTSPHCESKIKVLLPVSMFPKRRPYLLPALPRVFLLIEVIPAERLSHTFSCEFQGKTTSIWAQNISPLGSSSLSFSSQLSPAALLLQKKKKKKQTLGSGAVLKNPWSSAAGSKLTRQWTTSMPAGSIFKPPSPCFNSFCLTLFS